MMTFRSEAMEKRRARQVASRNMRKCSCGNIAPLNSKSGLCAQCELKLTYEQRENANEQEWNQIKTAPKDGSAILTYRGAKLMAVTMWLQDNNSKAKIIKDGCWCVTDGMIITNVTHWMPLPSPPSDE